MPIPAEVFLSHSSLDEAIVTPLADALRRHGVPIWYSKINILEAQQWQDEIGAALKRCDWFLVVLSPNAVNSMWVKREVQYALAQNRFADRIIALHAQPCDFESLSWVLSSIQRVDFDKGADAGYRDLLRIWAVGFQPVAP
jgi:hypothetical protein